LKKGVTPALEGGTDYPGASGVTGFSCSSRIGVTGGSVGGIGVHTDGKSYGVQSNSDSGIGVPRNLLTSLRLARCMVRDDIVSPLQSTTSAPREQKGPLE